jgi:hypothetical protein
MHTTTTITTATKSSWRFSKTFACHCQKIKNLYLQRLARRSIHAF